MTAEKIRHSSRIIPCSMISSCIASGLMGFVAILTLAFSIPDLGPFLPKDKILIPSPSTLVAIFYSGTGSRSLATAMALSIAVLVFGATLSVLSTSARHIFAFAKDEGLPFPHLWRQTTPIGDTSDAIPVNAFVLSLFFTTLAALMHLACEATTTFAIATCLACALTTYVIVLACVLGKRVLALDLPPARWSLGSFSIMFNFVALLYLLMALVVVLFPTTRENLSVRSANWSGIVWAVVLLFASIVYVLHGKYVFKNAGLAQNGSFDELPSSRST